MKVKNSNSTAANTYSLRTFATFAISLLLLIMLLSAFFIIPKANRLFESVHAQDLQTELALEAALFQRFVENKKTIVEDLATYPSLTSAVMLSDAKNLAIHELLDNIVIGGEKSRLILQDIAGTILVQTDNELRGNYASDQPWLEQILTGTIPYDFQLLNQNGLALSFRMSVPIIYNGFVEGILSSEITVPLNDIFVTPTFNNVAFKLIQDGVTISTGTEHIKIHRESSLRLENSNIVFIYITDDSLIEDGKRSLQNTILSVLFISFALSFILFALISYRSLRSKNTLKIKAVLWKRYSIPILVGLIGFSASITAYMIASNVKTSAIEKEHITESKQKIAAISKKVNLDMQVSDYVKAFFSASNSVSRQEFSTFIQPLLFSHQNIESIEWLPAVTHQQLGEFEQKANIDGLENFSIKEKNAGGEFIPATQRESYFPIYYVAPVLGNEQSLGFDLGSNQHCLAALTIAKNTGEKTATSQIVLSGKQGTQVGIHVFNPIYENTVLGNSADSQQNFLGFILTTLNVNKILSETLNTEKGNLVLYAEDVTDPDNIDIIYGVKVKNSTFSREEVINIGGRSWRIIMYTNTTKNPLVLSAWLVLIAGIIVSGLISLGIAHLIRRKEVVEDLVVNRTIELTNSEEQHRAVVENAVDGLLTINEFGTIEKFNQAAQRIFGYKAKEVIGVNIKILMPEPYHGEHDGYLKNYRDTGVKKIIGIGRHVEGRRKNGTIFPIDLSISEMAFGNTRKFSGIVRDISERVAIEKEREKLIEKLTDSNEELARFAFVCSHDLQEPLRMVRSFSEKLQEHLAVTLKDDAKGQKYFNFVIDGAARAQTLITDILSYSSISSDTQMFEKVDIEGIIKVINKDLLDTAEGSKGEITFDPLPELQGNKTQLFQLFQNLISNGLKYQQLNATPHVHIAVEDNDKYWLFIVKDNGIGMEARHLNKIFEVFQRLHGRSQYAGTGVGLSICKKVVERHGGTIWVESEKNIGSTFYVKLLKPIYLEEM